MTDLTHDHAGWLAPPEAQASFRLAARALVRASETGDLGAIHDAAAFVRELADWHRCPVCGRTLRFVPQKGDHHGPLSS